MKSFLKLNSDLAKMGSAAAALIAFAAGVSTAAAADFNGVAREAVQGRQLDTQKVDKTKAKPAEPREVRREGPREVRREGPREVRREGPREERRMERVERYQERRVYRAPIWRGDIRYFERHDMPRWRGGAWRHSRHDGRLGWWWVVGGLWYFYPQPVYPYPDPYMPPVVVTQPEPVQITPDIVVVPAAASQSWYYCESADGYYPYTPTCPEGWKTVPATPPANSSAVPTR